MYVYTTPLVKTRVPAPETKPDPSSADEEVPVKLKFAPVPLAVLTEAEPEMARFVLIVVPAP